MARGGRGGSQQPVRRPVDLTGIISIAERNDLATLINAITEKIHNGISITFDSPPVTPIQDDFNQHHWLSLSLPNSTPNGQASHVSLNNTGQAAPDSGCKSETDDKKGSEAMVPQLQELRKEAIVFFRKWQSAVLHRVRDISVTDLNDPQSGFRGRGRGFRGPLRPASNLLDRELASRYPPIPTTLWTLPLEKRKTLLHTTHLLILSLQEYSSYSRILLLHLTSSLGLSWKMFQAEEVRIAQGLSQVAIKASANQVIDQKQDENKAPRKPKLSHPGAISNQLAPELAAVGIGTPHGGHGLSPVVAAGLLGTMADNGLMAGPIFGIFSARPTSKMIESCAREIQDFGLIPLRGESPVDYVDATNMPAKDRRLRMAIVINGWLTNKDAVVQPWVTMGDQAEVLALRWDMAVLMNLGAALETVTKSTAWSTAKKEITSRTLFSNLIEASWPAALMKISKIIDNPWSLGMVRAEKAGVVLADALMRSKLQGDRPISLIGYSLGARAIYMCLMVLAERRQFGLVESVVLMGTPAPSESRVWLTLKSVVSGRLINVYSEHDYLLGFLYRTSNIHFGVAGLQQIHGAEGVENHDVSRLICEHLRYSCLIGKILKDVGWEDLNMAAIKDEKPERPMRQRGKGDKPRGGRMSKSN
ncbi:hypothetical protein EDB81DRAFT_929316 [Dactylonectria macrodidyma]|uniref:DUF726 domain-containing protein n=1 Tax=Dactylonectria macrodidyma TaxID=307937 RepID=A0A9P9F9B4_9HYPO|nr:hypothetical protein EDB81DRAFT_929316 [Dactylonectria macrodidyma]